MLKPDNPHYGDLMAGFNPTRSRAIRASQRLRQCHFCALPIPDDERAVQARTENAWAHFECWYDGKPFARDRLTGAQLTAQRS